MVERRCALCSHWRALDPRGGAWHRPGDGKCVALGEPRRSGTSAGECLTFERRPTGLLEQLSRAEKTT